MTRCRCGHYRSDHIRNFGCVACACVCYRRRRVVATKLAMPDAEAVAKEIEQICISVFQDDLTIKQGIKRLIALTDKQVREAERRLLWEYPCSDGKHDSFWKSVVTSPQWKAWEREVARRSHEHSQKNDKVYTGCWDVDECRECGWISQEHFQDFLKFTMSRRSREGEK